MSGGEGSARQTCSCRSPRHCDEIGDFAAISVGGNIAIAVGRGQQVAVGVVGVAAVAALLLWLVTVALILLIVDDARNLRAMMKAVATAPISK